MSDAAAQRWERLDVLLLLFGPLTHGLVLAAAWAWGSNWINWVAFLVVRFGVPVLQLAGVAATVMLMLWQRNSTFPPTPQRSFATSFLIFTVALSILVPWSDVIDWLRTQGRHQMEAGLPATALAEDCLSLVQKHTPELAANDGLVTVPPPLPPTLAKLGHVDVWVDGDGLLVGQGDGPWAWTRYGYRFFQETPEGDWVLAWFSGDQRERVASLAAPPKRPLLEGP